jgi:hypothetical protein
MQDPHFFGYGSLVNRATHGYAPARPARLRGWRRMWRHTDLHSAPFLTAVPDPRSEIDGLVAPVPGGDWQALDAREFGYDRHDVTHLVSPAPGMVQVYAVPEHRSAPPTVRLPIVLSYVDVVVQGYLREFGPEGARAFFATTDGWDGPLRDDRDAPLYPRHQRLDPAETAFVDAQLAALGVVPFRA